MFLFFTPVSTRPLSTTYIVGLPQNLHITFLPSRTIARKVIRLWSTDVYRRLVPDGFAGQMNDVCWTVKRSIPKLYHNTYRRTNRRNGIILNKPIYYCRNTVWRVRSVNGVMTSRWKISSNLTVLIIFVLVFYLRLYYGTYHGRRWSAKKISFGRLGFFQSPRPYARITPFLTNSLRYTSSFAFFNKMFPTLSFQKSLNLHWFSKHIIQQLTKKNIF